MECRVVGNQASYKDALSSLIIVLVICGLLLPALPAKAQGGLVACLSVGYDSVWEKYYTYEFGSSSVTGQVSLTDGSVFPYGDGQYGKLSFDLQGFGEDVFATSTVALYSVKFRASPDVITNTDVFTFVTPYSNGVAGRITQHGWVANVLSSGREWTDVYPELPQADSFSVAMFMPGTEDLSDFFALLEVCVYPVNTPTATPPESATPRPTRTASATRTATATRTRTNTPVGFTPSVTTTPTSSVTPGGPTVTPVASATPNETEGTPIPVPGTLSSGAWMPYEKPATCGEDDLNPCGPLPFAPVVFPPLNIASPSGIPTLTAVSEVTGTPGTVTPTISLDAQATALATISQYGGAGGYNIFTAANSIGNSVGFAFGMFNAIQSLNLGRVGLLIAFLLLVLLFIVFVRTSTFVARILLFLIGFLKLFI